MERKITLDEPEKKFIKNCSNGMHKIHEQLQRVYNKPDMTNNKRNKILRKCGHLASQLSNVLDIFAEKGETRDVKVDIFSGE